jgi:hypothetical protein
MSCSDASRTTSGPRSGLRSFVIACTATLACIAAINVSIDPYGYFGTPVVPGLTERKPTAFTNDRFLKSGLVSRSAADCLLAGNSRVGEGIPNDHPMLADCKQVLDISLAGPNMAETRESVAMAARRRPEAQLIVNIDFFSFNALRQATRGGSASPFATDIMSRAKALLSATLRMDVSLDSLTTLARQEDNAFYSNTGAVNQDYLQESANQRPTRAIFLRGLRGYIFHHLPAPAYAFSAQHNGSAPREDLRRFFLDRQASLGRTMVFISAPHAWQLELIDALGLWHEWEEWKRAVAQINEEVAQSTRRPPLQIWDFSGYGSHTTEDVPISYDQLGPTSSYWDNSHFRHNVGKLILDRMSGRDITSRFGTLLTRNSVDELLKDTRRAREIWRSSHPQDVEDVRAIVGCFAPQEVVVRLYLARPDRKVCTRFAELTR